MRLVYLSLFWTLGILLGSRYDISPLPILILLGITVLFTVLYYRSKPLLWIGLCFILLFSGILRLQGVAEGDELQSYRGFFELRGTVAADPEVKEYTTTLRIEVNEIREVDGEWGEVAGTVLVYAPKYPDWDDSRDFPYYRYGDFLQMKGSLEFPELPQEGSEFDFGAYLEGQGIYSTMYSPNDIVLIDAGRKPKPMELIYRLRRSMSQSLEGALPEPQCSLAKAMLLGQRSSIPEDVKEDFSRTGASHLLAISGVHVSIVSGLALSAGVWIFGRRRPTYFLVALTVIWLYVMLSGMSPSGIRAASMGSLWLYADWIGRPRSAFTALTFAGAVMLAFDPRLLASVAFQLSFTAMAGLIFLTPVFQTWGRRLLGDQDDQVSPIVNFVIMSFAVTSGAVITTLPLIAYYFNMISFMSLPASLLTLPAVPGIITTSVATGLVGMFAPAVASVTGWLSWFFITYVLKVIDSFASIPFTSVEIEVDMVTIGIYYGALMSILWIPKNRNQLKGNISKVRKQLLSAPGLISHVPAKWIILPLLVGSILMWTAVVTASDSRLHIRVLDVGQGDSILIHIGTQQVLIDGGPSSEAMVEQLGGKMPFWDRTIELVVLTHPDADHITGLIDVLQRYEVQKILTSGQKHDSDLYREWRNLIAEKGIERIEAKAGQEIIMKDGICITVLHPQKDSVEGAGKDVNSNSVVLRLEYDNFSLMLTGDIGEETEDLLLKKGVRLKSDVLKVAHHGSDTSTSSGFLNEVSPAFAAISVAEENKFGHPAEEVVDRLDEAMGMDKCYLTSEHGVIHFITDGQKLWIKTER